jgi:hypothetical protein
MSASGRRAVALAVTAAAVLIAPSVASAKIVTVSREVGLYATPDTSKPIRTIPPNTRVDVQCYTRGQSIGGYAVWDKIKNGNNGFAYVHDKYVEMQNKSGPDKNGIDSCDGTEPPSATSPKPTPGRCVGRTWPQYLSLIRQGPSGTESWTSWYRVEWTAKFCPVGNGDYRFEGTPEVREYTNRFAAIKALDFQLGEAHPTPDSTRVVYNPRLRMCPLTKHLPGACFTAASMRMMVSLVNGQVRFDRSVVTTQGARLVLRPNGYLGWRDKRDHGQVPFL